MLRIQTSNLPELQKSRLHPDFVANEQAYLRMRDSLLVNYRQQWVAVHQDTVVAAGPMLMDVMEQASAVAEHPYIALVGAEDAVVFRARRAVFAYDLNYQPFALPRVAATFLNHSETHSLQDSGVIPDTGADVTLLPDKDCSAIDLFNSPCMTGLASGVVGAGSTTLFYRGKVEIDARRYAALIQPIPSGQERIVGRDVLNQQRVLFDGPAGQVIVDP